jgi:threonine dehydrogenase-like Zn-dependent dehydrogenase
MPATAMLPTQIALQGAVSSLKADRVVCLISAAQQTCGTCHTLQTSACTANVVSQQVSYVGLMAGLFYFS